MALVIEPGFVPEEVFGPSALKLDHQCPTAYALRYAVGLREKQLTYDEVCQLPVPVEPKKPGKDASTGTVAAYKAKLKAYRKEKKAWNKQRRPALGTAGHAKAEAYFKGETVDWHDAPGKIMLAGLHYLPLPKRCQVIEPEQKIRVDLSYLYAELPELKTDPLILQGTRDLVVQATAAAWSGTEVVPPGFTQTELRWILIDHKTTLTFDFFDRDKTLKTVKTPEQLLEDEQVNLYGLNVMQEHGLGELRCRWIYYRTEDTPDARAVDVLITRKGAEAVVRDLAIQALELRRRMRLKHPWETLKKVYGSCGNYGGCIYDKKNGGPCPGSESESSGAKLVRLRHKQQLGEKLKAAKATEPKPEKKARPHIMAFRSAAAAAGITKPNAEKAPESAAEAQEPESAAEAQVETSAPAVETKPAPVKPKGSPRKNTNHEGVTAAFGGVVLELPPASPLAAAVVKAVEAHNAYMAALNGE